MTRLLAMVSSLAVFAGSAGAAEVMLARSNGALQASRAPGRYSALNILDGVPSTVWCSRGTGKGAEIEVVFSEKVDIDRIDIATGNQASPGSFAAFSRVRRLAIVVGDRTCGVEHPLDLDDQTGLQTEEVDPAVSTDRLVIRLKAGYRGKGKRHTCIADVIFHQGRRALDGKTLRAEVRKAVKNKRVLSFLDTWVAGPELHRDRELVFGLGGKYRFVYLPSDPVEASVRELGPWRLRKGAPEVRLGRDWVTVRARRDDAGRLIKLKIDEGKMHGIYSRHGP